VRSLSARLLAYRPIPCLAGAVPVFGALNFFPRSVLILNRDGKVQMVDGDGAVQESVWFSVHRGPGFVQRLMR